jgi:hypothetical protein
MEARSSRTVITWNSSPAPRGSKGEVLTSSTYGRQRGLGRRRGGQGEGSFLDRDVSVEVGSVDLTPACLSQRR